MSLGVRVSSCLSGSACPQIHVQLRGHPPCVPTHHVESAPMYDTLPCMCAPSVTYTLLPLTIWNLYPIMLTYLCGPSGLFFSGTSVQRRPDAWLILNCVCCGGIISGPYWCVRLLLAMIGEPCQPPICTCTHTHTHTYTHTHTHAQTVRPCILHECTAFM